MGGDFKALHFVVNDFCGYISLFLVISGVSTICIGIVFWKSYAIFYTNWWTNILLWPSSKRLVVCFQLIHGGSWSYFEVLFGDMRYLRFCCCHICQLFLTTACGSIFVPQLGWSIVGFLYPICLLRTPYCFGIFIDVGKSIFLIRVRKFFVFYNFTK